MAVSKKAGSYDQDLMRDMKVVQERLGHSTITTTMNIYSHVTPTMQKNAVEQFADIGQSGAGKTP